MPSRFVYTLFYGYAVQANLSFGTPAIQGTPLFRGDKIWSLKNVNIIFVSVTSTEGIFLFREKGPFFWVPQFREHISTLKVTDHKKRWQVLVVFTSRNGNYLNKIDALHSGEFITQYCWDKLIMISIHSKYFPDSDWLKAHA